MVGKLWHERQRTHAREALADDTEVERSDREARECSAARGADAGSIEHERPAQG
nr:hypothetical protein [Actinomycetota bacterium]